MKVVNSIFAHVTNCVAFTYQAKTWLNARDSTVLNFASIFTDLPQTSSEIREIILTELCANSIQNQHAWLQLQMWCCICMCLLFTLIFWLSTWNWRFFITFFREILIANLYGHNRLNPADVASIWTILIVPITCWLDSRALEARQHVIGLHDDVTKWKHFPCYWPFLRGIHRSPVNSPHKGQWRGTMVSSMIYAPEKRLGKQWWGWWFETSLHPLWRPCNDNLT